MSHPYALPVTDGAARQTTRGWLLLGVAALALAGLFAVLLVLARTPGVQALFPGVDLFRTALVVHVDLSVLVWFLAFSAVLWSLAAPASAGRFGRPGLILAALGTALLVLAPVLGSGTPLLSNYVPVLDQAPFFTALALFGAGVLVAAVGAATVPPRAPAESAAGALRFGAWTAALAVLLATLSLAVTLAERPAGLPPQTAYEVLFWGPGHTAQFAYSQLLAVVWLWLAAASGASVPLGPRPVTALLVLGTLPLLAVPVIHLLHTPESSAFREAFTRLMIWGGGVVTLPVGVAVVVGLWRSGEAPEALVPVRRALWGSLLLFAAGGAIGMAIRGTNTIIPAHYHGAIVGITLAFMGLTYRLLPLLGWPEVRGWMARWQPGVYVTGQLLHVGGLAVSGALGIQRKTSGAAQGLDALPKVVAMGVMGLGGLLAVVGGLLFVLAVGRALWEGRRPAG